MGSKRALVRLLVVAALAPVAMFGGAQAAFGQASVEGYTDPGGGSVTEVPPGGEVLGEGDTGGSGSSSIPLTAEECPPGTVPARRSGAGASGDGCVEPGGGDPGTRREAGAGGPSVSGGSLPFTGADLAAIGGVGLLLAALGFGLRRLTSTQSGS